MMFSDLLNKLPKHLADELNTVTIPGGEIITNQDAPPSDTDPATGGKWIGT